MRSPWMGWGTSRTTLASAAVAFLVAVVSACGSTAQLPRGSDGARGASGELGAGERSGPGSGQASVPSTGSARGGSQLARSGGSASSESGVQGPSGGIGGGAGSAAGLGTTGRGYTAKEIFLGFAYNEGA